MKAADFGNFDDLGLRLRPVGHSASLSTECELDQLQKSEPNGREDKAVHRGDARLVISKERLPALALVVVRLSLRAISRDAGEADRNPKLLKSGLDLSRIPAVLSRESTNQRLHIRWK